MRGVVRAGHPHPAAVLADARMGHGGQQRRVRAAAGARLQVPVHVRARALAPRARRAARRPLRPDAAGACLPLTRLTCIRVHRSRLSDD